MKIIIIGGVAGGATSAARLRRLNEENHIVVFEKGPYISYANCGLPYYIGGTIEDRDNLFVQTPEEFGRRYNLDVRVSTEVLSIDKTVKKVKVKNWVTGDIYEETYDKLILSPGASPIIPPLPGIDHPSIFTIRNVMDTDKIKDFITTRKPKKAIVVGAGFIGLEMAENLHHLGIQVSIVEMSDQMMNPIDYSMAAIVHQHLKTKNVEFYLNDGVASFNETEDNRLEVTLKSGRKLVEDMVILSIGVKPDNQLAKTADLTIGEMGGIKVNEYLQTSDESIYAVGDAIEFESPITKKPFLAYLAGPANRQGRICADNIIHGNTTQYKGSISTAIAKVFDITVASTGIAGKNLTRHGIEHMDSITHSSSHAGYYPGAIPMTIKIIFAPVTGKLLGAQIVGYEGVDKRIDLIATVLKNNGTIHDLIDIEHAYAPPYSSAKDPVNMAGYVAENMLNGNLKVKYWRDIKSKPSSSMYLIDTRTTHEFELDSIPGALNIPLDDIRERINEIPKDKEIVVFCAVGLRGYVAARSLKLLGFDNVYNLSGGYKTWEYAAKKQSNEDIYDNLIVKKDDQIYQHTTYTAQQDITAIKVDACGLQCPGPILKLKKVFETAPNGQVFEITATDPAFAKDVDSWCKITGNTLQSVKHENGKVIAVAQKEKPIQKLANTNSSDSKTFVVFSDDLDRALASFVIANGVASTGKKVTMFFTFWGLNVIKKANKPAVKKDFMGKMFSLMMPSNSRKLKLSKMNMLGMGTWMMRKRMEKLGVDSLEKMIQTAIDNGVEMIACQMSMDVMGVAKDELFDNVQIGGVAAFLESAEESNMSLFV